MMPLVQRLSFYYYFVIVINGIGFHMTLLRESKDVRSACCRICASPESTRDGEEKKKAAVGKAADRRAREERKEERQGEKRIRRAGSASQSEARSGAAEDGAGSPGLAGARRRLWGSPRTGAACPELWQSPLFASHTLSSFPPVRASQPR